MPDVWDQFPDVNLPQHNASDPWAAFPDHPGSDPNATPDAPTWLGRRLQDIQGKQDPRFKDLPVLKDALQAEGSLDVTRPMATSALFGSNDAALGDIAKKSLGDRFLGADKDANGYDIVHYKGADGTAKSAYINKPGLDLNDIGRAATGALPFLATGLGVGALTRGAGLAGRVLAQGLGAGATSAAGDVAQQPLGSDQGIDPVKAAIATGLGGAGEVAGAAGSALWQRFIEEPKYFDKTAGQLTPLGQQAARSLGLDPQAMTPDVSQTFARTYARNPAQTDQALATVTDREFNIPSTIGQRLKDPAKLMQEKGMRNSIYGANAKDLIDALDENQKTAIGKAVQETVPTTIAGVPTQVAGSPGDLGSSIGTGIASARGSAKAAEKAAWDAVPDIHPSGDAMALLPAVLNQHLADVAVDNVTTPAAAKMAQEMDRFVSGEAPDKVANVLSNNPLRTVDQMRRRLLSMSKGASTPEDARAASRLYEGFNDWIDVASRQGTLSGDPAAVAALRGARDVTKEMNGIFAPRSGGQLTAGGRVLDQIQKNGDTPERIVSGLFTGPKADIKSGAVEALTKIRDGLTRYSDPAAARATWNDIRLAHWSRMTTGTNGEVLGPQALMENLKSAMNKQGSLLDTLYSPEEIGQMRRLVTQLERVTYKDPNPSGTATGIAVFAKQFVGRILDAFGPFGRAAFEYSGIPRAYGTAIAKRAVAQQAPAAANALAGVGSVAPAAGNALYNQGQ